MILLLISVIVMLSAIVIYSGFHSKPKHYVRRISIRHVKLRKPQDQNKGLEQEEQDLDEDDTGVTFEDEDLIEDDLFGDD